MSEGSDLAAEPEWIGDRQAQPHRRNAHHSPATLAGVERLLGPAHAIAAQCRQAGPAGAAPFVERRYLAQPALRRSREAGVARLLPLRAEPAQVGAVDGAHDARVFGEGTAAHGEHQPLGGEERHLGVVGDGSGAHASGGKIAHALGPESRADLRQRRALYGCAEGVAHRPAEQGASHAT